LAITPVSKVWFPISRLGDCQFALAHLVLEDKKYANYFKNMSQLQYVILDNGAFELPEPLGLDEMVKAAELCGAHEIVAPDYPGNKDKTIEATFNFLDEYMGNLNVMVVPHGRNNYEWSCCYKELMRYSNPICFDTIGYSVLEHKRLGTRPEFVHYVRYKYPDIYFKKMHHLLGLDALMELYAYGGEVIRSVDTSLAISQAMWGEMMWFGESRHSRVPEGYEPDDDDLFRCAQNTKVLKHTARQLGEQMYANPEHLEIMRKTMQVLPKV